MNKKESLDFLDECIEKMRNLSDSDVKRLQRIYDYNRNLFGAKEDISSYRYVFDSIQTDVSLYEDNFLVETSFVCSTSEQVCLIAA
ncbi:MAG: hypothetical protein E7211_19060 [Clostridium lundense]|nr:hypothetical protein [Clostridium lundense]